MRWLCAAAVAAAAACATAGCGRKRAVGDPVPEVREPPVAAATAAPQEPSGTALGLLQQLALCDVLHRGAFLDLGSAAADGRYGFATTRPGEVRDLTREGASWAQIHGRTVSQRFYLDRAAPVFVAGRIRGVASRGASARIDGRGVGELRFGRGEAEVAATRPTSEPLPAGAHVLSLQFHGPVRAAAAAEIDWLRVGEPDEDPTTFAAPTLRDLVVDTVLEGRPVRALALRAPGSVRCLVGVAASSLLRTSIGVAGPGAAEAELRAIEPGQDPVVLRTAKLEGEGAAPARVEASLDAFAGKLVLLELAAKGAAPGARVLFGDPVVDQGRARLPPRRRARVVVLLVLSSADRGHLPPYGEAPALATLADLAPASVVFRRHRAPTTVVSGAMATLVTGLAPPSHGLSDPAARLPERWPTIATVARDGRVSSAMFTANPTTFGAFGFARGWDRFEQLSPVSGLASRTPISEATAWLEGRLQESKDGSVLVLVHARAGHPPWTATAEETKSLPPADYMGPIDARRGAQVLQRARAKRPKLRLSSADRERIEGFYRLALVSHDHALAGLIGMLRRLGAWDSTMLLVTSDVAMGGAGRVPFGDAEKLDEDLLSLPLLVRFPGGRFAGQAVDAATSTLDLARTVLGALELKPPEAVGGIDLFEVAANPERFALRPQLAVLGSEYSMRRGDWAIRAVAPKPPALCDFATQNACADAAPAAVAALLDPLFRQVYSSFRDANAREAAPTLREPATLDPDTSAALSVWGNQEAR